MNTKQISKGRWIKTKTPGLVKAEASGIFHSSVRLGPGKLLWENHKTTVYSVAQVLHRDFRARVKTGAKVDAGHLTMDRIMALYREKVSISGKLKPETKRGKLARLLRIEKTWPGLERLKPRTIGENELAEWSADLRPKPKRRHADPRKFEAFPRRHGLDPQRDSLEPPDRTKNAIRDPVCASGAG